MLKMVAFGSVDLLIFQALMSHYIVYLIGMKFLGLLPLEEVPRKCGTKFRYKKKRPVG